MSQALDVFGSSQNVLFWRTAACAQLAEAFAAERWDLSDAAEEASWGRDRMYERPEGRLEAVAARLVE